MRIEVKSASELSTFEKARQDCVVTSSLYAFLTGTKWATADWTVMVWEDEELVTNIHIIERTASAGEQQVRLGGIGNLATKVEWRKRGYATEALKTAVDFLHDPLKVDFGLMIATEKMIPSYEKRGWKVVSQSMRIEQPDGKQVFEIPVLILPVCKLEWPEGEIDLCGLPW
jgi:predicted GNAT family N-acyltransferase